VTATLLLKLLGLIIVFLTALAQAGIDYKWSDRRTKAHKHAKMSLLILLVVAVLCSAAFTVLDQRSNDGLRGQLTSLERKLDPFLELAKARFPGLDSEAALERLSAEIKEHETKITNLERDRAKAEIEQQTLTRKLDSERSLLRDFGADVAIDFSGDWTEEPWGYMVSSAAEQFHIYLWSKSTGSNPPLLKFFATEPYRFTTTGKGRARFQARQAVRRGDSLLGESVDALSHYDAIGFWLPFLDYKKLVNREITVSRIEIVFTFNGRRGKPLIFDGPFRAQVRDNDAKDPAAWAGFAQPFDPAVWKGMWPT